MKKEIKIKKTATQSAGKKYLEMAQAGPIAAKVEVKTDQRGRLEAFIDGEAIGFVKMDAEELPGIYEISIKGVVPGEKDTFLAEMDTPKTGKKAAKGYDEEKEKILTDGILEEEDLDKRILCMEDNNVFPSVIRAVLSEYEKFDAPLHVPSALYRNTRKKNAESILNQALIASLTHSALIFAGEKSTGKNVCAETIAYVRAQPYYRLNFQKDMLLEDVFGSKTTDNSAAEKLELDLARAKIRAELSLEKPSDEDLEKAAEFELLKAQSASIRLVQAQSDIIRWGKFGGTMMYDECNMANANILQAVMNSPADGEKTLIVPGVEAIKLHPRCTLIGGMNPGYAGTFDLNTATKSRCGFINFEFPEEIESQLMANFAEGTVLKKQQFATCNNLYKDFRAAVKQGRATNDCLNIRGFVNALKAVERFPDATTLAGQIELFVINGCSEDDRAVLTPILRDRVAI